MKLNYFSYYLEIFAKRLNGKELTNPANNGEYAVLKSIIKDYKINSNKKKNLIFIDAGANIGNHTLKFFELCQKYAVKDCYAYVIEPNPYLSANLKFKLKDRNYNLIEMAIGDKNKKVSFFLNSKNKLSGSSSIIKHSFLGQEIKLKQVTLDSILKIKKIDHINFLKMDIEGSEYNALIGARNLLKNKVIDYIQLEYAQTWIGSQATLEKILELCNYYGYRLFRIRTNDLLSIFRYSLAQEDFCYSNLLMVRRGRKLPLPCNRSAVPYV